MSSADQPVHTASCVDDVLITEELARRPHRAPDFEAESRALRLLAQEMAENPGGVLQKCAELAIELCRADSAGVSILEPGGESGIFRWQAAAGPFAANLHGTMLREASPCGTVIDRGSVLLFTGAERFFPALRGIEPRAHETLLVPWEAAGEAVGTLWAIKHTPEGRFEAEDARLLQSLARFASAAWKTIGALQDAREARQALKARMEERTAALRESKKRQGLLLKLSDMLRTLSTPADIAGAATRELRAQLGVARVAYGEIVGSLLRIERDDAHGVPSIVGEHPLDAFDSDFLAAYRPGEVVTVSDIEADERLNAAAKSELRARGIAAFADVVLPGDEQRAAILAVHHASPRTWTPAEQNLIHEVGERVRSAMERTRAEAALRESEARLRAVLSISTVGVLFWGPGFKLAEVNEAFLRMSGFAREEALGKTWQELTPPEFHAISQRCIDQVATGGECGTFEKQYLRKDGSRWWGLFAPRRIGDEIVEFVLDVTQRREAQEALRESEARFRQFGEASSDILWIRNAETLQLEYVSPAFEAIYGVDLQAMLSGNELKRWAELVHPDDRERVLDNLRRVRGGRQVTQEYRILRAADGEIRWIRDTDFPLLDERGRVQRIGGIGHDVTEEKESADRMRVMVAELQHRTRNLIAVVRSIAGQTIDSTASLEEFRTQFNSRLSALSRVQGLLSRSAQEPITIGALVRMELNALGADSARERIVLDGPEVPLRNRTVQTLALAIHELATNARKYGSLATDHGRLTVTWRVREADGEGPRLTLEWVEQGIDGQAKEQAQRGYGRELIEEALPYTLGARTSFELGDDGLRCSIDLPLDQHRAGEAA